MDEEEKFSEELKLFFKRKKMTQTDVANALGVRQAYVAALLNGRCNFGKKQAEKWNRLFGISKEFLLTHEGSILKAETKRGRHPTNEFTPRDRARLKRTLTTLAKQLQELADKL